jgi:hypothetical protein
MDRLSSIEDEYCVTFRSVRYNCIVVLGSERTNLIDSINIDRCSTSNQPSRRSEAPQIYIVLKSTYVLPCKFPDTAYLPFDHRVQCSSLS